MPEASWVLQVEQRLLAAMKEKSCLAKRLWEVTRKSAGLSWDLAGVSSKGVELGSFFYPFLGRSNWRGNKISMLDSHEG